MTKSMRVSEAEMRAMLRLMGEIGELPANELQARKQHLLQGLCHLLGAKAGSDVSSRRVKNGPRKREVCSGNVVHGLDDSELQVIANFLASLDPPDPLSAWIYPQVEAGATKTVTRRRILSDKEWYDNAHYNEVRLPARVPEPLIHSRPAGRDGRVRTISLHRTNGDRPFNEREAKLVGLFIDEAARLTATARDPTIALNGMSKADLSPRQRDVLDGILAGESVKQIASRLGLSRHTIAEYAQSLYRRLGVSGRAELMAKFVSRGS